jgi:hypothetical protein
MTKPTRLISRDELLQAALGKHSRLYEQGDALFHRHGAVEHKHGRCDGNRNGDEGPQGHRVLRLRARRRFARRCGCSEDGRTIHDCLLTLNDRRYSIHSLGDLECETLHVSKTRELRVLFSPDEIECIENRQTIRCKCCAMTKSWRKIRGSTKAVVFQIAGVCPSPRQVHKETAISTGQRIATIARRSGLRNSGCRDYRLSGSGSNETE